MAATPGASWSFPKLPGAPLARSRMIVLAIFISSLASSWRGLPQIFIFRAEFVASHSFMCVPQCACQLHVASRGSRAAGGPEVNTGTCGAVPGVSILGSSEHAQARASWPGPSAPARAPLGSSPSSGSPRLARTCPRCQWRANWGARSLRVDAAENAGQTHCQCQWRSASGPWPGRRPLGEGPTCGAPRAPACRRRKRQPPLAGRAHGPF